MAECRVESFSVSISPMALSFLMYNNQKAKYTQEGFLFGDVVEYKVDAITDNDRLQETVSRVVKINSTVACPSLRYFYDNIGRIDRKKIKGFLRHLEAKVVGWYIYQASPGSPFTFRARLVHQELSKAFNIAPELFTVCLLTSDVSEARSTHSFTQNIWTYNNGQLLEIPLKVNNLGESNNQYRPAEPASEVLTTIMKKLKVQQNAHGLQTVKTIQEALKEHTDSLVQELIDAKMKLLREEEEIQELEKCLREKRLASALADQQATKPNIEFVAEDYVGCLQEILHADSISNDVGKGKKNVTRKAVKDCL